MLGYLWKFVKKRKNLLLSELQNIDPYRRKWEEMGSVTIKFKMAGYLSLREQYAFCMF